MWGGFRAGKAPTPLASGVTPWMRCTGSEDILYTDVDQAVCHFIQILKIARDSEVYIVHEAACCGPRTCKRRQNGHKRPKCLIKLMAILVPFMRSGTSDSLGRMCTVHAAVRKGVDGDTKSMQPHA